MRIIISLIIYFLGISAIHAFASSDRNMVIGNELDCIEQNKNSALGWTNVCSAPNNSAINQRIALSPQEISASAFGDRVHTLSIVPQGFYYHYSEPEKIRKVTGYWEGLQAQYTFRPLAGNIFNTPILNYYALEGFYADGHYKLDENEQSALDNSIAKIIDRNVPGYMFEDRFLTGRDFLPLDRLRLTPYTGFGIRYQTDHTSGSYILMSDGLTAILGYDRSETYYYVPFGLTMDVAANNDYEISLNTEYDYFVKGYARYDYAGVDQYTLPLAGFTNQNLRYSQNNGWGFRASLRLLKHFSTTDVYLEPYLRYWKIGASKVASGNVGGGEFINTANKNNTLELGSSLGVQF